MSTSELTGSDLRHAVYQLVARELGTAALVRFIQENYPGHGDYTTERQLLQQPDIETLKRELENYH